MEDKRIVVAFDIHETILLGFIGYLNKIYKGKYDFLGIISHIACDSLPLVAIYTFFTVRNKSICKKMKELYEQRDIYKVILLTDSYKSCSKALKNILKMKGIYYYDELVCRDHISEDVFTHKLKKIKKYGVQFIYDDNPDMRWIMLQTNCYTIGMID